MHVHVIIHTVLFSLKDNTQSEIDNTFFSGDEWVQKIVTFDR